MAGSEDKKEEKKGEDFDPWAATEETYTKEILGVEVEFWADPPARLVNQIARRYRDDPDEGNYQLVRLIVKKPEISRERWKNMSAKAQTLLLREVLKIIGAEESLF